MSASPPRDNGNVLETSSPTRRAASTWWAWRARAWGRFAGMLKAAGYEVTGSDENVYPPMSDMLEAWGIAGA